MAFMDKVVELLELNTQEHHAQLAAASAQFAELRKDTKSFNAEFGDFLTKEGTRLLNRAWPK